MIPKISSNEKEKKQHSFKLRSTAKNIPFSQLDLGKVKLFRFSLLTNPNMLSASSLQINTAESSFLFTQLLSGVPIYYQLFKVRGARGLRLAAVILVRRAL